MLASTGLWILWWALPRFLLARGARCLYHQHRCALVLLSIRSGTSILHEYVGDCIIHVEVHVGVRFMEDFLDIQRPAIVSTRIPIKAPSTIDTHPAPGLSFFHVFCIILASSPSVRSSGSCSGIIKEKGFPPAPSSQGRTLTVRRKKTMA